MRIFLSAGEPSGDLHAANLARALRTLYPKAALVGLGGDRMRSAGVTVLYPLPRLALIGFVEVTRHVVAIWKVWRTVRRSWESERPDVVVLIDFPGLHLRLAGLASSLHIPVVYYIAPQMWAWGENRIRALRERTRRLLVILPFEERFFRRHGVESVFVGHPLMDLLAGTEPRPAGTIDPHHATIGLLPGSRRVELLRMLPAMLDAARRMRSAHNQTRFILPLAETLDRGILDRFRLPDWVEVVRDPAYKYRRQMDLAWTSSGTATLENAVLRVPTIIVYRTGWLNAVLARRLIRTPYIGLTNLVAGYGVCPELVQEQVCGANLSSWTLDFLEDEERQRLMLEGLSRVRDALGPPGASNRAAVEILDVGAGPD